MKREDEIKQELTEMESENIREICRLLQEHEKDIITYLAHIVASLCDVTYEELMSNEGGYYIAQSRWLFWHTYRYITNEPYSKMAERLGQHGHTFAPNSIIHGTNKMGMMIADDTIWKKRWIILKRISRMYNEASTIQIPELNEEKIPVVNVRIEKPAGVEVNVNVVNV